MNEPTIFLVSFKPCGCVYRVVRNPTPFEVVPLVAGSINHEWSYTDPGLHRCWRHQQQVEPKSQEPPTVLDISFDDLIDVISNPNCAGGRISAQPAAYRIKQLLEQRAKVFLKPI